MKVLLLYCFYWVYMGGLYGRDQFGGYFDQYGNYYVQYYIFKGQVYIKVDDIGQYCDDGVNQIQFGKAVDKVKDYGFDQEFQQDDDVFGVQGFFDFYQVGVFFDGNEYDVGYIDDVNKYSKQFNYNIYQVENVEEVIEDIGNYG